MTYYTGSIVAVPTSRRQDYLDFAAASWPLFQRLGARRLCECWGVDVPKGKINDLTSAVLAQDDETVVFSWIEWPDQATADAAWPQLDADPQRQEMPEMPFDGSRMIFGGFAPIFSAGSDRSGKYIQGFALAVPATNKAAYVAMARDAWEGAFRPQGCLGLVESWGQDVPHGKQTDFYRASLAEEGEVPVFSWALWPDKATCDAAAKAMAADMAGQEFPQMPFDGKRMMWGGFERLFDSHP